MAAPLTPKQTEIYDFILQYTRQYGYPPSVREIGFAVNLKSPSTVHFHMKKLEAEGLMRAEAKRPLPRLPRRIGLVTSPRGAAVYDVLRTLRRRYPLAEVLVAGVPVEGKDAPAHLAAGLDGVAAAGA